MSTGLVFPLENFSLLLPNFTTLRNTNLYAINLELADNLKAANIGIGAQWPKQMHDARKTLIRGYGTGKSKRECGKICERQAVH